MNTIPDRLPSRPLRNWFLAWHIHTGDPPELIAKGFGLDPVLAADLLRGEVPLMMPTEEAQAISAAVRVCDRELWPSMVTVGHHRCSPVEPIPRELESLLTALGGRDS